MRTNINKITILYFLPMFVEGIKFASCAEIFANVEAFDEREIRNDYANLNKFEGRTTSSKILENLHFDLNAGAEVKIDKSRNLEKRSRLLQDDSIEQPTVINNIQIIVSENASKSSIDKCKNGICNISVSSRKDNDGNVVTDVHINLITKLSDDSRNNEIPIVDGIRGLENSNDYVNRTRSSIYNFYNNIPQIQSRYQGGEPWYQGRMIFQRPKIRPIIDDKIEPPLSKT